ncbi:hypothetical protein H2203_000400 [Taxawa tesnikishii (nom. ined.)]|nr:hypothetical protein H2203_000400 [Dothideales sp. JES 119]
MASNDGSTGARDLDPRDIIFSCSICHATVSDIYKNPESNKGLSDGRAPFHPAGQHPKSICPVCVRDDGDKRPKDLFAIRGFSPGEYDDDIPNNWFEVPPIQLDAKVPGMEALRFQYLTLVRYSTSITEQTRKIRLKYARTYEMLSREKNERRQLQSQAQHLKARITELESAEKALRRWKEKEPAINHYLKVLTDMAGELNDLRDLAERAGYKVPRRSYAFDPEAAETPGRMKPVKVSDGDVDMVDNYYPNGNLTSGHEAALGTKRGSSATTLVDGGIGSNPSARKRKHGQYEADFTEIRQPRTSTLRRDSRDLMPPPALPTMKRTQQQMSEAMDVDDARPQVLNPTNRPVHAAGHSITQGPTIQVFNDDEWQVPVSQAQSVPRRNAPERPLPELAMMSGAILQDDRTVHNRLDVTGYAQPSQLNSQRHVSQAENFASQNHSNSLHQQHPHGASYSDARNPSAMPQNSVSGEIAPSSQCTPAAARDASGASSIAPTSGQGASCRTSDTFSTKISSLRQRPDASVASPFFRAEASRERPFDRRQIYRPPTQYENRETQHIPQSYRMAPDPRAPAYTQPEIARALNGLSFIQSPQMISRDQPLYDQSPARYTRYSQTPAIPQTPRDAQGLLMRPDGLQSRHRQSLRSGNLSQSHSKRLHYLRYSHRSQRSMSLSHEGAMRKTRLCWLVCQESKGLRSTLKQVNRTLVFRMVNHVVHVLLPAAVGASGAEYCNYSRQDV